MKYMLLTIFAFALISCGSDTGTIDADSLVAEEIPDSVPQMVMQGKAADWAYKPDTSVNDIVLGSTTCMKQWVYDNGNAGILEGNRRMMQYYCNNETQVMTIYTVQDSNGIMVPFGLRVTAIDSNQRKTMRIQNFTIERAFITGHGIYMYEPLDYVQKVYKSQPMMKWIKGDTTYLAYAPQDKDKGYFTKYRHVDYSALYKFVNDQLRVAEMSVDPEVFEKKK